MKYVRSLATGAVSVLAVGGVALVSLGSSPAVSAGSVEMPNCHNTIQGVVVDQGGHHVDDVNVEAYNAKGVGPVASALTYANPDNDIRHGYFALCVGRGTFTLHLSKTGYKSVDDVEAGYLAFGRTRSLGEQTLKKKLEDSTTKVVLAKDQIKVGDLAKGTVKIITDGATPTGKWQVLVDGHKEDGGKLSADDDGKVSFSVDGLSRGTHKFQASYGGDIYVKESDSGKVALDVVKRKR